MKKKLSTYFAVVTAIIYNTVNAYALKISSNAKPSDFDKYTISDFQGVVLGTLFLLLRLLGIVGVIWGFYGVVMAKKIGDPSRYGAALTKLVLGFCMIGLPAILKAANIISVG